MNTTMLGATHSDEFANRFYSESGFLFNNPSVPVPYVCNTHTSWSRHQRYDISYSTANTARSVYIRHSYARHYEKISSYKCSKSRTRKQIISKIKDRIMYP